MMPKIDIEDSRLSFARVTYKVDGVEYLAKSVTYGDGIEFADIEGNSQMSAGTSDGVYKADEGTIEFYADEFAQIMEAMGDKFYEKRFEVTAAYEKSGSSKLTADTLIGCRWTKRAVSDQSGPDGLTRSLSFKPAYIKMNGKNPLSKMPTGAK